MSKIVSEGKCYFCNTVYKKAGINRHLSKHLVEKTTQNSKGTSFHIKIQTHPDWGSTPYFLSLWVDGNTTLDQLDDFLRAIWLECCGHLSAFKVPKLEQRQFLGAFEAEDLLKAGKVEEYDALMTKMTGEIPKHQKVSEVFYKGQKLKYQYDFGSTTELQITALETYPVKADKPIVLLSRNEPLHLICESCREDSAQYMCSICYGYEEEGIFCNNCVEGHEDECEDFADYASIPIVNSPRMGVCGYEGGTIDQARDSINNAKMK